MRICTNCILPESFPGIDFDDEGVCNYCRSQQPVKVLGDEKLAETLESYRNKGDKYDCVVPISGGRDSTYVLHQIVSKYKMRAIALTVDSGFILPEGIRNIEVVSKALDVPHVWLRDDDKIKISRRNTIIKFHGWLKKPSINTIIPVLNAGDKTMNLRMAHYAKQHNIPLVLGGNFIGNCSFEEEYWKRGFMGVFGNDRGAFTTGAKIKLIWLFALEFIRNSSNFKLPILREYITGGAIYFFEKLFRPRGIDSLGFYDYIYWKEKDIMDTITPLGWVGAADHTTTWRIDDSAYPLLNYMYNKLVGFTEHDEMYSRLIREHQMTRDDALKRVKADHESPWIHGQRIITSLEELGATKEQLDKVLNTYRPVLMKKLGKEHLE
ncbi:hypothetical protein ACFLXH_04055 [Chloroflexota bacterium]